jgi:twitching motility protein PilT
VDRAKFEKFLSAATRAGASDIHIKSGAQPSLRVNGLLKEVKTEPISAAALEDLAAYMLQDSGYAPQDMASMRDLDSSFVVDGVGRFRVNVFRQQGHLSAVLRVIPNDIPTLDELNLPPVLKSIAQSERGLVLVTGVTGSGKSTTLAALVNEINRTCRKHIVTIEDPVEFIHQDQQSRVSQREIGRDTESFALALRAALRQDPDVILVGEMRDAVTIDTALKAAETGHLVLSTVHTTDAAKTVGRIIDVFPHDAQPAVRIRLAENLKATISQRLLRRSDGQGRVVAMEIMVMTLMAQELIREPERTHELTDYIQKGRELYGSQSFDQHLIELYQEGVVSLEVAKQAASNPSDFERSLYIST